MADFVLSKLLNGWLLYVVLELIQLGYFKIRDLSSSEMCILVHNALEAN